MAACTILRLCLLQSSGRQGRSGATMLALQAVMASLTGTSEFQKL